MIGNLSQGQGSGWGGARWVAFDQAHSCAASLYDTYLIPARHGGRACAGHLPDTRDMVVEHVVILPVLSGILHQLEELPFCVPSLRVRVDEPQQGRVGRRDAAIGVSLQEAPPRLAHPHAGAHGGVVVKGLDRMRQVRFEGRVPACASSIRRDRREGEWVGGGRLAPTATYSRTTSLYADVDGARSICARSSGRQAQSPASTLPASHQCGPPSRPLRWQPGTQLAAALASPPPAPSREHRRSSVLPSLEYEHSRRAAAGAITRPPSPV